MPRRPAFVLLRAPRLATGALLCALASPPAHAQASLSLSCPVCHGPRDAPSAVPSFYALPTAQLESVLRDFRSGAREGTAMPRLAKAMSDEEIQALAYEYGAAMR